MILQEPTGRALIQVAEDGENSIGTISVNAF